MHPYLRYATEKQAEIVSLIREMAECESPSSSARDVDRFVDLMVERTRDIATAETIQTDGYGRLLRLTFDLGGSQNQGQLLALGHSDTVWPLGTLSTMPVIESHGRLWGPGVLDMKAGLAFFVFACRSLLESDARLRRKVVMLVVPDEEIGSGISRQYTEAEAKQSDCVLVLEPGMGWAGKLKTSRKGVGEYSLLIEGKASHAGVDFEDGASAILEAAKQIQTIAAFTNSARGITVNPGLIQGGTRRNVVPAKCRVDIDVRIERLADAVELDRKFHHLSPEDQRCRIHVEGGLNRPPMERTAAIAHLFQQAQEAGAQMGVPIEESATGGGSDGNFTAALGIPTLDGLGAVGEGAHAKNESILLDRIADRVALLAALIELV